MKFDQLLAKGRWKHVSTARIYLDQALQEYTALVLPPAVSQRVRAANQRFAAELGRVEVGLGGFDRERVFAFFVRWHLTPAKCAE